jgi:hypothetical protein
MLQPRLVLNPWMRKLHAQVITDHFNFLVYGIDLAVRSIRRLLDESFGVVKLSFIILYIYEWGMIIIHGNPVLWKKMIGRNLVDSISINLISLLYAILYIYIIIYIHIPAPFTAKNYERWLMFALPGGFNSASQPVGWASACASMLPCPAGRSWGHGQRSRYLTNHEVCKWKPSSRLNVPWIPMIFWLYPMKFSKSHHLRIQAEIIPPGCCQLLFASCCQLRYFPFL